MNIIDLFWLLQQQTHPILYIASPISFISKLMFKTLATSMETRLDSINHTLDNTNMVIVHFSNNNKRMKPYLRDATTNIYPTQSRTTLIWIKLINKYYSHVICNCYCTISQLWSCTVWPTIITYLHKISTTE